MNDYLYEAIRISLLEDIKGIFEYFNEDTENLEGVIVQLNSSRGLGNYLISNPNKITEFVEYLSDNLYFSIKLIISKDDDEKFYPLVKN